MLVLIDGRARDVGDISTVSDDDLVDLAAAVSAEVKRRIGRCDRCLRKHSEFQLCPTNPPVMRETESDFEVALKRKFEGG